MVSGPRGDCVALEAGPRGETATGKVDHNLYHFLFEGRDGKIEAVREYLDTLYAKEVLVDPYSRIPDSWAKLIRFATKQHHG